MLPPQEPGARGTEPSGREWPGRAAPWAVPGVPTSVPGVGCVCVCARPASSRPSKLALHAQACLCLEQRWDSGPGSLMPADLPPSHRGSQVPGPPAARGPGEAWAAGDGRWPHPPCGTLEVAGRLLRATGAGRGPTPRPAGGQPSGTVQACSSGSRWRRAGSGAGPGVDIRPCCSGPARPPATVVKMNGCPPSPR